MIGWADAEIPAKHCTLASEQSKFYAHPSFAWIALLSGQHDPTVLRAPQALRLVAGLPIWLALPSLLWPWIRQS